MIQSTEKCALEKHNDLIASVKAQLKQCKGKHYRDLKKHYDKLIAQKRTYIKLHQEVIKEASA